MVCLFGGISSVEMFVCVIVRSVYAYLLSVVTARKEASPSNLKLDGKIKVFFLGVSIE